VKLISPKPIGPIRIKHIPERPGCGATHCTALRRLGDCDASPATGWAHGERSVWVETQGDSSGARCLKQPYRLVEQTDEVIMEIKVPFWMDKDDIKVRVSERTQPPHSVNDS
jgi:hypothetical protein